MSDHPPVLQLQKPDALENDRLKVEKNLDSDTYSSCKTVHRYCYRVCT